MIKGWRIIALTPAGVTALKNFSGSDKRVSVVVVCDDPYSVVYLVQHKVLKRVLCEDAVRIKVSREFRVFSCVEDVDYKLEVIE